MYLNKTLVIFDFDGTLLNSISGAYRGTCSVFEREGLNTPSFEEFSLGFKPPYLDFYRVRGVQAAESDIYDQYHSIAHHEEAVLFPDTEEVIKKLYAHGCLMAVVSSQRQKVLDMHCNGVLREFFTHVIGDVEYKAPVIKSLVKRLGCRPQDVFYVGDFVSDVSAALEAKVVPVGITRGFPARQSLVEAGAKFCIDRLEELVPIVIQSQPA